MTRTSAEWSSLDDQEMLIIDRGKRTAAYRKGEFIFSEGQSCHSIYCIESGMVALRMSNSSGKSVMIRLVLAGEIFGFLDLFADDTYTTDAQVFQAGRICEIPGKNVRDLVSRNSNLEYRLLKHAAVDRKLTEASLMHLFTLNVHTRLAQLLWRLMCQYGNYLGTGAVKIIIPLARGELADILNIRPETLARAIGDFERGDIAFFSGRAVLVPKLNRLQEILQDAGLQYEPAPFIDKMALNRGLGRAPHPIGESGLQ